MRTFIAHRPEIDGCKWAYRVSSVRKGATHAFDSQQLNAALGDAVGLLQPSWTVDLEKPDVCVICLLTDRRAIVGLLLPPLVSRKSTALPAEHRSWFVAGIDRPHMRPSRAALLVRLINPKPGDVVLDPTGGVGLIAIEAACYADVTAYTLDLDEAACDAARANASAAKADGSLVGTVEVVCADASKMDDRDGFLTNGSIDVVVADLPFGMLHQQRLDVGALLTSLARLLKVGGRCVLVGNGGNGGVAHSVKKASKKYPRNDSWRLDSETPFAYGGLTCVAVALTLINVPPARNSTKSKGKAKAAAAPAAAAPAPPPRMSRWWWCAALSIPTVVAWSLSSGTQPPIAMRFVPSPGVPSLDVDGLVYYLPSFLNESEITHLLEIAKSDGRFHRTVYHSVEFFRPWEPRSDEVTRAIEARIGEVTGIQAHEGDSPLRIAVNRPWTHATADEDGDSQALQNLHHDTNERPRRVATVLMYLSGGDEDDQEGRSLVEGGETLLPCVKPRGSAGSVNTDLCERLRRGFESGERFLSPPRGIHSGRCFDETAAAVASDLCKAPTASGLRIAPKRGAAVLFLSASPEADGGILWNMWHGGCRVQRGEKWTMQQFKELPI